MIGTKRIKEVSPIEALGEENIPRLALRFTGTTLVALLLNAVYNLSDALFVSWGVGDNAMGGVSIVFPFAILQGAIATAVGGGAASIVSRKLGEGQRTRAGEVTLNAMLTFYITAIIITALGFAFMDPLLHAMGVTNELYPYAKEYFIIILAGNIFSTGFSSIIRAEGKMLYALLIWVIPITINIILDAVFILVLGWGVRGSALSTVICQFASFCMSVLFFVRFSSQDFKGARLRLKTVLEVLAIGLPSLVQMGSLSIISVLLNNVIGSAGGTLAVNTYAYMSKIITFVLVPFTAVTQALAPIAGYNYGAGKVDRVRALIKFCVLISFVYAVFSFAVVETMPNVLMRIFTSNEQIIFLGTNGLRIIATALVFTPLPILAGATFQAIGRKIWALIMYAANLLFLIPIAGTMAKYFGMKGVWWAYVIANACATILVLIKVYFQEFRHKPDKSQ